MLSGFVFPDRNSDTSWAALLLNRGPYLSFIYSPWVVSESSYVSKIAFDSLQFPSYLHFCLVSLSFGHAGENSEKNNLSVCPYFLFQFLILPYSWHKTIKRYVIWVPTKWKPVIINRQVNRATPAVVITHKCQRSWLCCSSIPRWRPNQVSEILLILELLGLRNCSSWVMYKWCTDKPSQNGTHLLTIILSKFILNPSAFQMQHQQKVQIMYFPSQGSPALLRCLPEQSLPKPSSLTGPKLDCIRRSLAWQPVACTFLWGLDRETIPLRAPEVKACPHPGGRHCISPSQKQLLLNFKHGSLQHCWRTRISL